MAKTKIYPFFSEEKKKKCVELFYRKTQENITSPDIPEIFLYKSLPVFVYGTMKKGFPDNEQYLRDEGTYYIGAGFTLSNKFTMKETSEPWRYPIVFHKDLVSKEKGEVYGELYLVKPETLVNMDYIENNNDVFNREKHWVKIYSSVHKIHFNCNAWMYIADPDSWKSNFSRDRVRLSSLYKKQTEEREYFMFSRTRKD